MTRQMYMSMYIKGVEYEHFLIILALTLPDSFIILTRLFVIIVEYVWLLLLLLHMLLEHLRTVGCLVKSHHQ